MGRPPLDYNELGEISVGGKTSGGRYRARARYRTKSGRTVSVEASGKSIAEAKRRLQRRVRDWMPDQQRTLFRDVAGQWLESLEAQGESRPQTIDTYRRVIRTTLEPHIGSRTMGSLTTGLIDEMFQTIAADSPGNYGTAKTACSGILEFAVRRGVLDTNPMPKLKRRNLPTKEVKVLSLEQLAHLRGNVRDWQAQPRRSQPLLDVVDLALSTAARIGELLAAKWADVNFESRTLTLWSTQVWVKGLGIVDQDETKETTILTIHLTDFAMRMLEKRRQADPEGTYIFATRKGTMIARANLDRAWRSARGDTFEWVTWHTFRKSVATLAANASDSATAAKLLGHTSDRVTKDHYIAESDNHHVPDMSAVLEALAGDKADVLDTEKD